MHFKNYLSFSVPKFKDKTPASGSRATICSEAAMELEAIMPKELIQAEKNKDRVFSPRDGKEVILRADKWFLETRTDAAGRVEEG